MKPSLSIKVLLRTPFKTLLTFLILVAASFALFSRVSEYSVIKREMKRATGYYRGVCALDTGVPNTADRSPYSQIHETDVRPPALTITQIEDFASLPQVTSTDIRYMTAGISDIYRRIDMTGESSYNYTARFVMEGTFSESKYIDESSPNINSFDLKFTDCELLAGDPSILLGKSRIAVMQVYAEEGISVGSTVGIGGGWGADRAYYYISNNPFGERFVNNLNVGSRYLLIGRWEPKIAEFLLAGGLIYSLPRYIMLGDNDTLEYCDSFWPLDGKPENYLETEEFSRVREIIEITNNDLKTFDIVYTTDMLAIPRFTEGKMAIAEGRALNKEDLGSNYCVVSNVFLKMNKLKLGDKIKMGLCTKLLEQHWGMGAVACIPERYSSPAEDVELEIVGVYIDTDGAMDRAAYMYWCYSPNTIFVPSSLLPIDPPQDHKIYPGEFSLVIGNARKIEAFLEIAEPMAEKQGLSLRFNDGGWSHVSRNIRVSSQMSLVTTTLFVIASAVALLIAVYLFIGRGKREYAIMRALGTSSSMAKSALYLRIGILSALALPMGAAMGLIYTSRTVSAALADIASAVVADYVPDASIHTGVIIACILGEIIFLSMLIILMLRRLDHIRLLELLQGDGGGRGRKQRTSAGTFERASIAQNQHEIPAEIPVSEEPMGEPVSEEYMRADLMKPAGSRADVKKPEGGRYGAVRHVARYIVRHMGRMGWKTVLPILLAIIFPGATGFFAIMQLSYENLFKCIEIKSYITNISSDSVIAAEESDLIRNPYYQGVFDAYCNGIISEPMIVTNDLNRFAQGDVSVQYADGYDSLTIPSGKNQCFVGNELAKVLGLAPGDEISLIGSDRLRVLLMIYDGQEFEDQIEQNSISYKVIGVVTTQNAIANRSIISPAGRMAEKVYGGVFLMEYGEFTLADNEMADELREFSEMLVNRSLRYSQLATYTMDTTELDNITRIMRLLKLLFPIAVAASIFIVFISSGLMILQLSKEAAILRVLGTSKKRTRCMLALEQIILCITGLCTAAAGLAFYNRELFVNAASTLVLCSGSYFLACALAVSLASVIVTQNRVLELLQTKE